MSCTLTCLCFSLVPYLTELITIKARNCFTFCARLGFLLDVQRTHLHGGFLACQHWQCCYLTKGAKESRVGGFLSPNMWLDLKIQLPGFFCLLVSILLQCVLGMCGRTLLRSGRSVGGTGSHFPLPKSADLEPALPQALLCLLSLILCLYSSFHPFSVVLDKRLAGCGCGPSH